MTIRRTLSYLVVLTLISVAVGSFLTGCEEIPTEPVFANIFDPNNPDGGNALQLAANMSGGSILLTWNQPQNFGISYYEITHSFNFFSDFLPIANVDQTTIAIGTFRYENAEPTRTHYFRIQAFDDLGNFTNVSDQIPASRTTPPRVVIGDESGRVASRNITLAVTVSSGEFLRVSNDEDFANETVLAVADLGQPQEIPWQLPAVASNDTNLVVRVLVMMGSTPSDTAIVPLDVNFAPAITVEGYPSTVPMRDLVLNIPDVGVQQMRFASSEAGLAAELWTPGGDTQDYLLDNSGNAQEIWGEFQGDFGFNTITSRTVRPDLLNNVSFSLDLPADHLTDESSVTVLASAVATHMRFSESLDFSSEPWVAYADTSSLSVSATPGHKTIYCQFRNDWAESDILTDYVIYLSQPLDVVITAPLDGDLVPSDLNLQVRGTTTAASGTAAVDLVRFDSGDGLGFVDVTGTDNWSFMWAVPSVVEETDHTLRARAWAGGDSVTTTISVTLLPPPAEAVPE